MLGVLGNRRDCAIEGRKNLDAPNINGMMPRKYLPQQMGTGLWTMTKKRKSELHRSRTRMTGAQVQEVTPKVQLFF